jgi:NB-ARC domain/Rx N-terminal domain
MNFFLEKPFEFLVSTFGQIVVDRWKQISHIDSNLDNLRVALPKAHGLIRRSECWSLPEYEPVKKLLPELKDAVYEAECILDELEYQRLKHKVEKSLAGEFLSRHFDSWMSGFPKKVKQVQENLYNLCKEMENTCNELQIPENHNQFSETARPVTTTFSNTPNVYGRDKELNNVIHLLGVPRFKSGSGCQKRKRKQKMEKGNVSMISVVGGGGVGKTTLAQMVCNESNVKGYFEAIIWVCITENFDAEKLTVEILQSVTNNRSDHTNLDSLQKKLQSKLKSRRFLLVLDDAWSDKERDWQLLLGPIREGKEGSAILVTTRSCKVAEVASNGMRSMGPINLNGLEEKIYWEFFKSCAFGLEVRTESFPELEEIGKEICRKLKGSPLAAKTIGGLLKINLDVGHWSNIRDSKMWQLKQEEHDILPVLQLSYQYLSSDLKKCFSFCSLYPKDHKFKKTELFKFWIMCGFINSPENSQQARDILAEKNFNELVRRCFFEKAPGSHSDEYVIHDLMHDVCQSITKGECFCLEDEYFEDKVPLDIRHLSVFQTNLILDNANALIRYKKLLSLRIVFPSTSPTTTIENWCKNLTRILSIRSLSLGFLLDIDNLFLDGYNNLRLHKRIGNLKHLQYLDISFSNIHELPDSLCSLYNLKYLNMEGCGCYCSFPEGSDKLVSLQIFYFPYVGMPLEGSVINLTKKIVAKGLRLESADKIQNLKHISISGDLDISGLEAVPSKETAEEAELKNKPLINTLSLCWSKNRSIINEYHEEEVLERLCPHPNLKELTIRDYGCRYLSPSWLKEEFLPNLTKLYIKFCKQLTNLENCLRPEHLPALKHLEISFCKELMSVESVGGFLSLEELEILYCPKLTCPNDMVLPPSLKLLHLKSCGDLGKSISSCLRNLTSLEKLDISP